MSDLLLNIDNIEDLIVTLIDPYVQLFWNHISIVRISTGHYHKKDGYIPIYYGRRTDFQFI